MPACHVEGWITWKVWGSPNVTCMIFPASKNVVKRSQATSEAISVPASQHGVSPDVATEPEHPAPQANFCPDEATAGTPDINRRVSSLMLSAALQSRRR